MLQCGSLFVTQMNIVQQQCPMDAASKNSCASKADNARAIEVEADDARGRMGSGHRWYGVQNLREVCTAYERRDDVQIRSIGQFGASHEHINFGWSLYSSQLYQEIVSLR